MGGGIIGVASLPEYPVQVGLRSKSFFILVCFEYFVNLVILRQDEMLGIAVQPEHTLQGGPAPNLTPRKEGEEWGLGLERRRLQ